MEQHSWKSVHSLSPHLSPSLSLSLSISMFTNMHVHTNNSWISDWFKDTFKLRRRKRAAALTCDLCTTMSTGSSEDVLNAGNYGPARFFSAPRSLSLFLSISLVLYRCLWVCPSRSLYYIYFLIFSFFSLPLSHLMIKNFIHLHTFYSLYLCAISSCLKYVVPTSPRRSPSWPSPWRRCWRWWVLYRLILLSQRYIFIKYNAGTENISVVEADFLKLSSILSCTPLCICFEWLHKDVHDYLVISKRMI